MKKRLFKLVLWMTLLVASVGFAAQEETIDIEVSKKWVDGEATHPDAVVQLYADGQAVSGKTITLSEGQWTGKFEQVPKYRSAQAIQYTVEEVNVPSGYRAEAKPLASEEGDSYTYPTDLYTGTDEKTAGTAAFSPLAGNGGWKISTDLATASVEASHVVLKHFDINEATLTEYDANGVVVTGEERLFRLGKYNDYEVNSGNYPSVVFFPVEKAYDGKQTVYTTDHYITLTFPDAALYSNGSYEGVLTDVEVTISNFDFLVKYTETDPNKTGICVCASTANGLVVYSGGYGGRHAGGSHDVNAKVKGVNEGHLLMPFVDIDIKRSPNNRDESVALKEGDFEPEILTVPQALSTYLKVEEQDGYLRFTTKGVSDSNTFKSGFVAVARLSENGINLKWTGTYCGTYTFKSTEPIRLKVTIDELVNGGTGGTATGQGPWRFRNYGENEIITLTPEPFHHIDSLKIDGKQIDLTTGFVEGVKKVKTGYGTSAKETIELHQLADGAINVVLPAQPFIDANLQQVKPSDHWIDVSYAFHGGTEKWEITNTKVMAVTGKKIWVDGKTDHTADNPSLSLKLKQNGKDYAYNTITWNGDQFTIPDLPQVDEAGNAYTYTLEEETYPGFVPQITGTNPFEITNTRMQEKITVTGYKTWVDGGLEHDNAKDTVLTLSRESESTPKETVTDKQPVWSGNNYRFADLPKYDAKGYPFTYSVEERVSDEMAAKVLPYYQYATTQDGLNFTNTLTDMVPFRFYKQWKDKLPEHPTPQFELRYPDGSLCRSVNEPPMLTDAEKGEYTYWLPDDQDYFVTEMSMPDYVPLYVNAKGSPYQNVKDRVYNGGVIENHHVPQTGDHSRPALWTALGGLNLLLIVWLVVNGKRKRKGMEK